jgi:hypothetical protein
MGKPRAFADGGLGALCAELIEGCARLAQGVRFFAPLSLSETLAPLPLLQGIAWIDQSAVSIV